MDLIQRAREYAVSAHKRINHRRKYTQQPYSVHLAAVAKRVAAVTDDPQVIAAAWLHDVVEDTAATLFDMEREFGHAVAALVQELTDVSKPSDGNRAVRKELDRAHLAQASPQAKTIKLADLIDNCQDICRNDPRFAKVYLAEMAALLDVLKDGHETLYREAQDVYRQCLHSMDVSPVQAEFEEPVSYLSRRLNNNAQLVRLFTRSFTAQDIAEPVRSFDLDRSSKTVASVMLDQSLDIVCVRDDGGIVGYLQRSDLSGDGPCGQYLRAFREDQLLTSDSPLSDVIHVLTLHQYAFVTLLGDVVGYLSRSEINKPVVRMWLFGVITFMEMELVQIIKNVYPDESWRPLLSEGRLAKALALQEERQRRQQHCELIDCLQLSDKGQILMQNPQMLQLFEIDSKKSAQRVVRELESLRNHLAHAQDIITHDWAPIVRLSYRLEETLTLRRPKPLKS